MAAVGRGSVRLGYVFPEIPGTLSLLAVATGYAASKMAPVKPKITTSEIFMDKRWLCLHWTTLKWIDILDRNVFRDPPNETFILSHDLVQEATGELAKARFTLERTGRTIRMHYNKVKEVADWNEAQGLDFELGTLVLHFKDEDFQSLEKNVEWQYPDTKNQNSEPCKEVSLTAIAGNSFKIGSGTKKRRVGSVVQRDSRFRRSVMGAYNSRCAITGCSVPEALQAAHISPYAGTTSDVVSNGMLLRSDLHALFDSFQMTIHPETLVPHFSSSAFALSHCEYRKLANRGQAINQPEQLFYRTDRALLRKHWNQFQKRAKRPIFPEIF